MGRGERERDRRGDLSDLTTTVRGGERERECLCERAVVT